MEEGVQGGNVVGEVRYPLSAGKSTHFAYNRAMVSSRNKGASFERSVVRSLNDFFSDNGIEVQCKRNLEQYAAKNLCDIEIPGWALECKAYKSGWWYAEPWWEQVKEACGDRIPALIWKFNNKPVRVTLPIHAINHGFPKDNDKVVVVTFDQWLDILLNNKYFESEAA